MLHNATKQRVDEQHLPTYRTENSHVDVEFLVVPDGDLPTKVAALFAAGSSPHIFNPANGPATAMLDLGWAAEVDYRAIGLRSTQGFVNAYTSAVVLDGWKWRDKYYGLPTEVNTYCLYINNRMFRKAGLDPNKDYPKDWDEMLEVSRKLTVRDGGSIVQRGFDPYYAAAHNAWGGQGYQLAGPILNEAGRVNASHEGYIKTLQWWADWPRKHQLGDPKLPTTDLMIDETLAMQMNGTNVAAGIGRRNAELFRDISIRPMPRWRDKQFDLDVLHEVDLALAGERGSATGPSPPRPRSPGGRARARRPRRSGSG